MSNSSLDPPLIDRKTALQNVQHDEAFLDEIYTIFLEEIPIRRKAFSAALEGDAADTIVGLAHSLKGVSSTIGAVSCSEKALELEEAAKEGRTGEVPGLYAELDAILLGLENELKKMGYECAD